MMRFNQPPPQQQQLMARPGTQAFGGGGPPRLQLAGGAQRQQMAQPRQQLAGANPWARAPQQQLMAGANPWGRTSQPPRPMAPRAPQQQARPQLMSANPWARAPGAPASRNPMAGAGANMGASMMSDERSKKRIAELENLNEQYSALLDTPSATADVRPKAPPTDDLDRSNARALGEAGSYSYEYKDPNAPGASPGRHSGPMAQELEGIPGVVRPGPDGLKRVDTGRLALATASATGDQERRLRALESDYDALGDNEQLARELDEAEQRELARIRGAR